MIKPSLHAETLSVYSDGDRESAHIRAAHLSAVVRLTPYTMAANVGNGAMVVWAFRSAVPAALWWWLAALCALAGLATLSWWRHRRRPWNTASPRTIQRATLHASALAALWAVVPLAWFAGATGTQQLLMAMLFTGMMGAGAFVLSPLPMASMAYVAIFSLGALGAFWQSGEPLLLGAAVLLALYATVIVLGSLAASRTATALLRSRAEALRQERMMAVLLQDFEQHAADALWETGSDGCLTHVSPRLATLLGVGDDELRDRPLLSLLERRGAAAAAALRSTLEAGRPFRDLRLALPEGTGWRHWSVHGKRRVDEDGRTLGWRGVLTDVTDEVLGQQRLEQLAHSDSLTGLANRLTLHETLREALRQGQHGALLSLDLDHFKAVNDSLGHTAGDEVLKTVSRRLSGCIRPGDLVARLGGDEFAVLMLHSDRTEDAAALAQRLIDTLTQAVEFDGRRLRIGASVGVVMCSGAGASVDELLVHADMALYAAKAAGRGRHEFYAPHLGERSRRRLAIEQGLRLAIDRGQLALHWQPKVDLARWHIVGAEALLRWEHPELGQIAPAEFIAVAEQSGLIQELGTWALNEACRAAAGPLRGLAVSVNLSPTQLRDGDCSARVRDALQRHQVDPSRLELEITESVFIDDASGALEQLHGLRRLGVRIALDDFGTGYSSLAYLRRFPFDTLKIDRAFVHDLLLRDDAKPIVHMIAQLAASLGMRTVAEGVESASQLSAVVQAGCHEGQGHLMSPPGSLDKLLALRRDWTGRPHPLAARLH